MTNWLEICRAAEAMSRLAVAEMEALLSDDETSLMPRIQLIGYYRARLDSESVERWHHHVLLQVRFHPKVDIYGLSDIPRDLYPEAYDRVHDEWKRVLAACPNDQTLLDRAFDFHVCADAVYALDLIQRGLQQDSVSSKWFIRLARWHRLHTQDQQLESALTSAIARSEGLQRSMLLAELARSQRRTDVVSAASSAEAALAMAAAFPYVVHTANIVLGWKLLRSGEFERAAECLLRSIAVSGSSLMSVYGPDLELANELLIQGSRREVVSYLTQCESLSPEHAKLYQKWALDVEGWSLPTLRYDDLIQP